MVSPLPKLNTPIISLEECRRFVIDCMLAVGAPRKHAEAEADLLVDADYKGYYSHGMQRLEFYLSEIQNGLCRVDASPSILKETAATAWVDGHNGLGVVVANYCMNLAIEKAKKCGIGIVVCKGSNHYCIAGYYSLHAARKGMIGLSFSNASPVVAPTRTKHAVLGTNPISCAAPAFGDHFLLDISTCTVAVGRIELLKRSGAPIPEAWVHPETGALQPLGGTEQNSSYKGYGLGVMVEILCGILGGSNFGPNIRVFGSLDKLANLAHCFIAIDPEGFAPGFEKRLYDFMSILRGMEPMDPKKPVLVAGDLEKMHMKAVDELGGLRFVPDVLTSCERLAESLNVKPLKSKQKIK